MKRQPDNSRIGHCVAVHRKNMRMSQAELARRAGCSTVTLTDIENGSFPALVVLHRICKALDMTMMDLFLNCFGDRCIERKDDLYHDNVVNLFFATQSRPHAN